MGDDYDLSGPGIPMTDNAGDSVPGNIDTLLQGGEPNQDIIPMDEHQPVGDQVEKEVPDPNAQKADETAQDPAKTPEPTAADPVVSQLQEQFAKLTPEQQEKFYGAREINFNGQKFSVPPDKQVPLMQMGLNYSERMRALNVEKQTFETEKTAVAEAKKYYEAIDQAAKANPEWWEHVKASYQAKISGNAGNPAGNHTGSETSGAVMTPELRGALAKITDLEQKLDGFLGKQTQEAELKQVQAQDAVLDQQIASVKKDYPEFDWMTADQSGHVLEDRIILHAQKNGIQNFRAAARDMLFDDIVSRREMKAKETIGKDIQAKTKAGVVVTKPKASGLQPPKDLNRTYSDLMTEGLAELG